MIRWLPALLLVACIDDPEVEQVMFTADLERFATEVQPILEAKCSNPACHGASDRVLALYAVHQHRMDPADVYRDDPLTQGELLENFTRACGFLVALERAEDCLLVRKPLARAAGGTYHGGGVQYADTSDDELRILVEWIETGLPEEEP